MPPWPYRPTMPRLPRYSAMARLTPLQRVAMRRTVRRAMRRYWRPVRPWVAVLLALWLNALHVAMLPH